MKNPVLAKKVRYYKVEPEGVDCMCEISEKNSQGGPERGTYRGKGADDSKGNETNRLFFF